jgi:hypothetical protein
MASDGGKRSPPDGSTLSAFAWRDWGKTRNIVSCPGFEPSASLIYCSVTGGPTWSVLSHLKPAFIEHAHIAPRVGVRAARWQLPERDLGGRYWLIHHIENDISIRFAPEEFCILDVKPCSPLKVNQCFGRTSSGSKKPGWQKVVNRAVDPEMEATCSSETSVDFQRTTRRYIPEERILHNSRCENLKSYRGVLLCVGNVTANPYSQQRAVS